jgi:proteasome accessory factor C
MEQADSLRRALDKLGRALGTSGEDDEGAAIAVRFEESPGDHMEVLQKGLALHKQVHIEYLSSSRSELSTRDVDPWGLVAALGRWYLVGHDHRSDEERMFRVDRIKSATLTDKDAPPAQDFDAERYKGAFVGREGQPTVTMQISPDAARWFEDYYPVRSSKDLPDGWREVQLFSSSDTWSATLVLRLGQQVREVSPSSVIETARTMAAAIETRYAS